MSNDCVGRADRRGRERRKRNEVVVVVEREPLESGGACTNREVEDVLGGMKERASGEEEWRREERTE